MTLVTIFYLMMCVIDPGAGKFLDSSRCPGFTRFTRKIEYLKTCECKPILVTDSYFLSLECQSINSTEIFSHVTPSSSNIQSGEIAINNINSIQNRNDFSYIKTLTDWIDVKKTIKHLNIKDSNLDCISLSDFTSFINLNKLTITNSKITKLNGCDTKSNRYESEEKIVESVETLDLSKNKIQTIQSTDFKVFPKLKSINLSKNSIQELEDIFPDLRHLETLDLSFNQLDASLRQHVFDGLTKSVKWIDISSKHHFSNHF